MRAIGGAGAGPIANGILRSYPAPLLQVRGPYAFLGNGWVGCSQQFEYPASQFNADYGDALGFCAETAPSSGIFVREFTKSTVQMDCNSYTPTITFK